MRIFIYLIILVLSVGITFKVTFDMTQEVVGSLFLQGIIGDHEVNFKLKTALEAGDQQAVSKIIYEQESYSVDLLETLVSSLESGNYTFFTKDKVSNGRNYLNSHEQKNEIN